MDEAESSAPMPPGWAEIKDQWRRYGLAEGMRQHSEPTSAFEGPAVGAFEVPDHDRLTNRVLELERALDIQAAIVRQLVTRIDRLERGTGAYVELEDRVDPDAEAQPSRVHLDQTWSWLRARMARGRDGSAPRDR